MRYHSRRPDDAAIRLRLRELAATRRRFGYRRLEIFLGREGIAAGRRHVATLMKRMGIEAVYRRRNTSKPAPGHKIYPYRLRGVTVERPNQVWATDITYIPMARGFRLSAEAQKRTGLEQTIPAPYPRVRASQE